MLLGLPKCINVSYYGNLQLMKVCVNKLITIYIITVVDI